MRSQKQSPSSIDIQELVGMPKTSFCTPQKTKKKVPRSLPHNDVTSVEKDSKLKRLEKDLEESRTLNTFYAEKLKETEFKVKELQIELEKAYLTHKDTDEYKKTLLSMYESHIFKFHQLYLEKFVDERKDCCCERRAQVSTNTSHFEDSLHELFTDS